MNSPWRDWLILLQTPGVGPVTWGKLMQRFGSPSAVLAAGCDALREFRLREDACKWIENPDLQKIDASLEWLEISGNHLIPLGDDGYPPLLAQISNPPPLLFITGNPQVLHQPQIAIVGTRNSSPNGTMVAREFARNLAAAGFTITSGLALGIDAAAHEGALLAGTTIAVSATGPDRVYPAAHKDLAHRIVATGAMVTELIPGTAVQRENFPQRNRIISGLSLGVLVVEAGAKSGALITATTALEQNREVFAIPGSIHNPMSKGCHALIRQGAKLVETAEDIVEELGTLLGSLLTPSTQPVITAPPKKGISKKLPEAIKPSEAKKSSVARKPPEDQDSQTILTHLGHDPVAQEVLIQRSGFPAQKVSELLLTLELNGYVTTMPGGFYSLVEDFALRPQ